MNAEPELSYISRLESRIVATDNLVAELERQLADANAELARFKRRCYPTGADVALSGISAVQCIAWLDGKFERTGESLGRTWYSWLVSIDGDPPTHLTLSRLESIDEHEIAEAIENASDLLGLDQWAVLAEMAAIKVPPVAP